MRPLPQGGQQQCTSVGLPALVVEFQQVFTPGFPGSESTRLIELAPSILAADFAHLADQIHAAEQGGAAVLHMDVMDGHFVPNLTIGPPLIASVRKVTKLPLDCHLMVENPDNFIPAFKDAGADWISVHQEACVHLHRSIE